MYRGDCSRGVWPGVTLILLGGAFLLSNYGLVSFRNLWPIAFIGVGISHLLPHRNAGRTVFGLAWLVIGGALLLNTTGWSSLGIRELWPLFVIAGGISMAFGGRHRISKASSNEVAQ